MHCDRVVAGVSAGVTVHKGTLRSLDALAGKISPQNAGEILPPGGQGRGRMSPKTEINGELRRLTSATVAPSNGRLPNLRSGSATEPRSGGPAETRGTDLPDPDTIKMFVGQVPRHMDENDIRKMFEVFGPIHEVNVLRDRVTGESRGCCFVTFYHRRSALDAQNDLHNVKTLPGMHHPVQMKPADAENRNERKLFVGMLSKKYNETDVRELFQSYGPIEECTVLRDTNGHSKGGTPPNSKGCAFVTFASRQYAIAAIKGMHQAQTMEGCSAPIVVKFADTQREKDAKRVQSLAANLWTTSGVNASALNPQYLALLQQLSGGSCLSPMSVTGVTGMNGLASPHLLSAAIQNGHGLSVAPSGAACNGTSGQNPSAPSLQTLVANLHSSVPNYSSVGGLASLPGLTSNGAVIPGLPCGGSSAVSPLPVTSSLGLGGTVTSSLGLGGTMTSSLGLGGPVTSLAGLGGSMTSLAGLGVGVDSLGSFPGLQQYPGFALSQVALSPVGRQQEGPDGANLFIYHLPQEFTDADLVRTFAPFGTVLSAKVFIDKQTNLSKCFGFVSYDNSASSQAAIQAMNGFQVGTKRLKVQLKRSRDAAKPY